MKIAVIGSRSFNDYDLVKKELASIQDITEIVSGGASGADTLAARYARENGIRLTEFYPEWEKFGRAAGPKRNTSIVCSVDNKESSYGIHRKN